MQKESVNFVFERVMGPNSSDTKENMRTDFHTFKFITRKKRLKFKGAFPRKNQQAIFIRFFWNPCEKIEIMTLYPLLNQNFFHRSDLILGLTLKEIT